MKIAIISFTRSGRETSRQIASALSGKGYVVSETVKCKEYEETYTGTIGEWTKQQFSCQDGLVFVGAVGIAVRAIAPFIVSKKVDPAVLVVDEKGTYCIPILSGHIGGANDLARLISDHIHAIPVVTTATDLNQKWAVDVFAVKNKLQITDMTLAKETAAALLREEVVPIYIDPEIEVSGEIPQELKVSYLEKTKVPERDTFSGVYIGIRKPEKKILSLIPKSVILGIGCRKGTAESEIARTVTQVLEKHAIDERAVRCVASIDLKAEEPGLLEFCRKKELQFITYSAEELQAVEGDFSDSPFVEKITGVGNVCERSAVLAGGEKFLVRKTADQGVTVAVCVKKRRVCFE